MNKDVLARMCLTLFIGFLIVGAIELFPALLAVKDQGMNPLFTPIVLLLIAGILLFVVLRYLRKVGLI